MMTEYVILGAVLIVLAGVQMWLRYGSWGKELKAAQEKKEDGPVVTDRGAKLWNKWTAILGPLGLALGLALLIWGLAG